MKAVKTRRKNAEAGEGTDSGDSGESPTPTGPKTGAGPEGTP